MRESGFQIGLKRANLHRNWSTTISKAADNLKKAGWSYGYVSAVDSQGRTIWIADAHRDGQRFIVRADEKGLIDLWARDLCDALRNNRVNDHANPEYRRENNSNSSCRESYDDDHCQPSETCSPMALVPKSNRAEEES